MKSTSAALLAHLASTAQTTAECARFELRDGSMRRFTNHDSDLIIEGWTGDDAVLNGTYIALAGFLRSDIATQAALNVDNLEINGPQISPSLVEEDITAGRWNHAQIRLFLVNWADLTMGRHYLRVGTIGEVTFEDGKFKAEFRGLMQRYTSTLVELTTPSCRATFGDGRCRFDVSTVTVTGTLTADSADGMTLLDSGRTEDGAVGGTGGGGVAITGISNANPAVVTMVDGSLALVDGQSVTISGVAGATWANSVWTVRSPSGATFSLGFDATDTGIFAPYASGGQVFTLSAGRSLFDGGTLTMTSGQNAGFSQDVKSYVTGQLTLVLPLPYPASSGDTYTLVQGCGKDFFSDCRDRFDNVLNFRGEPYVAGLDKLLQVGRAT